MHDRPRSRLLASIAGALALHGVGVISSALVAGRSAPEVVLQTPAVDLGSTEIEIAVDQPLPGGGDQTATADRFSDGAPARRIAAVRTPRPEAHGHGESASTAIEINPAEGSYSLSPLAAPGDKKHVELGIGPGNLALWAGAAKPAEAPSATRGAPAPAPVSTTGGLAEALEAHDQQIGLGPEGPVISAAREAAHSDVAPALGTASFTITAMQNGDVTVDLTAASSQAEGWNKVGAIMAAAIKRKPPRVPGSRRGVRIGIELVAEERWPSGSLARGEAPRFEIKLPNITTTDEAKEDLAKRNPLAVAPPGDPGRMPPLKANVELPGVYLKGRGKVCAYQLGVTPFGIGLGGGCDPSNVGANPMRVVSARVTGQTML